MISATDVLSMVCTRAKADTGRTFPGLSAMVSASRNLWADEFESWRTLNALGMRAAAECAWERRCAAWDLHVIFLSAL